MAKETIPTDKVPPTFVTVSSERFDGFFQYVPGNQITGQIKEEKIKPKTDKEGKTRDKGFFAIKVIVGGVTQCNTDEKDTEGFKANEGQIIAVPYTEATKVLRGATGKVTRITYIKMSKNGERKFHEFKVELAE